MFLTAVAIQVEARPRKAHSRVRAARVHRAPKPRIVKAKAVARYHHIHHRGRNYYYRSGAFYRLVGAEYVVLDEVPVGVVIQELPEGTERVVIRKKVYYRYNGIYYRAKRGGFKVVVRPV